MHYYSFSRFLWHTNTTTHRASQKHKFLHGLSVLSCTLVDKNKRPDQARLISPASVRKKHMHVHTMAQTMRWSKNTSSSNKQTPEK